MTDYSKGLLYLIKHKDDINNETCYIGSTVNFNGRQNNHKSRCNNENSEAYNSKKYKYIRENGGWDDFVMLEIEKYPCEYKQELTKREDEVMCQYNVILNERRSSRTKEQYYQDTKETRKEY